MPDVRVVVYRGVPVMAMIRLPTRASDGKANLNLGGVGAGIDIASGRTIGAVCRNRPLRHHPDTLESLIHHPPSRYPRASAWRAHPRLA